MLSWIREKFGTVVISGIIGFIAFVFVFYGIFSPKATRGIHDGAVAGKVNGDSISISEFNREKNRRIEFFKNMSGGQMSEEQIRAFRLDEMVFQDLVRRKLLIQEAQRQGLVAGDEQVKETIRSMPVFQKDGRFDLATYKQVLESNQYSPGSFERLIREDASQQQWDAYFRRRAQVTAEEARREFLSSRERRKFKYVLLTFEAGRKKLAISDAEIQKYLSEPVKLNLAKSQFDLKKDGPYKGKTFDQVKEAIGRDLIASEKLTEVQAANEKLSQQVLPLLGADKGSDSKLNAMLKEVGVEVKTSEWIQRQTQFLPGIGEATELVRDAFMRKSPIDASQGGKAKKYSTAGGVLIALITEAEKADPGKFEAEKEKIMRQIAMKRSRELYSAWMAELMKKAKIDMNPSIVGSSGEAG